MRIMHIVWKCWTIHELSTTLKRSNGLKTNENVMSFFTTIGLLYKWSVQTWHEYKVKCIGSALSVPWIMRYWKKESVLPLKEGTDVLDDLLFLEKAGFCEWAEEGHAISSPSREHCVPRIPVSPEVRYFYISNSTEKSQLDWLVCFAHYVRIII